MTTALAKKRNSQPDKTLEEVSLSLDGQKIIFLFENGEGFSISRRHFPGDDGSPITHIEIFDHGCAVAVHQTSDNTYDLPWDSIRHYAKEGKRKKLHAGSLICSLRKKHNLTQAQFAWRAGLSRVHLTRLEQNKSEPTLDTLEKIAKAFNLSLADLLHL